MIFRAGLLRCCRTASVAMLLMTPVARADDWPQWRGPLRDGVWHETGLLQRFAAGEIALRWRATIGPGYSGPTVADRRVYVMDRVTVPAQQERIHCFDAGSGTELWSRAYPCQYRISYTAGPRASVTIEEGRAYCLGAMGRLHCLDAGTGTVLWDRDLNGDYGIRMPTWGIAGSPLIAGDGVVVQIGGKGACVVALDKRTGREKWRALSDGASYSAPILIRQGDRAVVVCWTADSVAGMDAASGEVRWRYAFPPQQMPIGIATPVVSDGRLFVSSFYDGSLMLRLIDEPPSVAKLWQRRGPSETATDALHALISTPVFAGDHIYGVDSYGELRCLDAHTGDRLWEDRSATPRERWATIHMVRNGEDVWMLNERGELMIGRLSPDGFRELSRARLLSPTTDQLKRGGAGVCWAHPAFAGRHVFARNDRELVCADLSAP